MSYNEQAKQIETLCKSIIKKSKAFAKRNVKEPYFIDLMSVISDLKEADNFLKQNYETI